MSKMSDLTALVWGIGKSLLLISQNKSSNGNVKTAYSSFLGGIVNLRPLYKTGVSLSINL